MCIEVAAKHESLDSIGHSTANSVREDLGIQNVSKIRYTEAYYIEGLSKNEAKPIAEKVFLGPIAQTYSINKNAYPEFCFLIEVKFHPDVTDNLAIVTKEAIEDFLGKKLDGKITTSRKYYIYGNVSREAAEKIASGLLANGIIETYKIEGKP